MENSDQIGRSALNRIENLERVVNRFKIVVAGDGNVSGGFGKLPANQAMLPLATRLANIQQAREKFRLVGFNIQVGGTFEDGFTVS